jgi:hypothetical protein
VSVWQVTATRITGLASSGVTDGSGTWNEDVDLDSFVTVPSGATGVIMGITNEQGSPRWAGLRTAGKTTALWQADQSLDSYRQEIVPLGAGNTIDCYTEETAQCHFYILGFVDWTFFDIDGALPSVASTSGSNSTITAPTEVPSGANNMLMRAMTGGWMPVGESTIMTASVGDAQILVKLDASKQVVFNTTNANGVLGYAPNADISWTAWLVTSESITADGAAHTGTSSNTNADFAHIQWDSYSTGEGFGTRRAGSSVPPLPVVNTFGRAQWPQLNASGQYDYIAESSWGNTAYVIAWLNKAATNAHVKRAINLLLSGEET